MAKEKKAPRPKAETPKGFRDYFGAEVTHRTAMLGKIAAVYHRYGFDALESSGVETVEALGKFLPHEQQLLARMPPHEPVIGPQVRELLPLVARHLLQHRAFAMHDLIVTDRQDEVLAERIVQTEGHLVMMEAAMDRLFLDVFKRVVHPAHVPLVTKA